MNINSFDKPPVERIKRSNQYLKESFGIAVKPFSKRETLMKIRESAHRKMVAMRGSNKRFHLDPEYCKLLALHETSDLMLQEGMYAQNEGYRAMCEMLEGTVAELLNSGYSLDEACGECMNRYRQDPRWCYDDQFVLPLVITAAKKYMEGMHDQDAMMEQEGQMDEGAFYEKMSRVMTLPENTTVSQRLESMYEYVNELAEGMGQTPQIMREFIMRLDAEKVPQAIAAFEGKIRKNLEEQNAFNLAAAAAARKGKKQFEFPEGSGEMHPVTMDPQTAKEISEGDAFIRADDLLNEQGRLDLDHISELLAQAILSEDAEKIAMYKKQYNTMYESIYGETSVRAQDIISEDVDIDQAEVVMAAQGLSSELQDQIEKLGRLMNEDLVAIVDQMRYEMGAQVASQFQDEVGGALNTQLENAKQAKQTIDNSIVTIAGGEIMGTEQTPAPEEPDMGAGDEDGLGVEEPRENEPEDQDELDLDDADLPLGREESEGL